MRPLIAFHPRPFIVTLDAAHPCFHHLNLRPTIHRAYWENEQHLKTALSV